MLRSSILICGVLAVGAAGMSAARANVVLEWNEIMVATTAAQNPFAQGRSAAITQLAVFEAVNAVTGEYEPYLGTVESPSGASAEAAAIAAAHGVLVHYFPGNAAALDLHRAQSLGALPDGAATDSGVAVGAAAAAAMIAARANDGAAPPLFHTPGAAVAGEWQATAGCPPAGGILAHWQNVAPFGVETADQLRAAPPPDLGSHEYAKSFNEVQRVGSATSVARPQHRADVARFYNSVLAVGVWNPVARVLAATHPSTLTADARMLALMNMAISDALVTVMETKYHYRFWRPETAVPAGGDDGNPKTAADPSFVPLLATPCFPSYPSAHASASYAARAVLERLYGGRPISIELSTPLLPDITLHYARLAQITNDIDDARVYGGIHFRFDQTAGAVQGGRIGDYVVANNLRSAHEPRGRAQCAPDESFKTCLLRATRLHRLRGAIEGRERRRSSWH
jgi:hypothetical protein